MKRFASPTTLLLTVSLVGLAFGLSARFLDAETMARWAFRVTATVALLDLLRETVGKLRRRRLDVDVVALLALIGALLAGEELAAAVIALMLSGGRALEARAEARAARTLTALLDRVPRTAHRLAGEELREVPLEAVAPGDLLLVRAGEVVPVDGRVVSGHAVLDLAALTGESAPQAHGVGDDVPSGVVNVGDPFRVRASRPAAESTYAGIVRLVEEARKGRGEFARLADRAALAFVPVTLLIAGLAWWLGGDANRALAVLVVATPCPLLLAAPIAMVCGLSRAASRGILVKGGRILEALARTRTVLLDKTGTLTTGTPRVAAIEAVDGAPEDLLGLAASVDRVSSHVLARALVAEATRRNLPLVEVHEARERPGAGVEARVDGARIRVGSYEYVTAQASAGPWVDDVLRRMGDEGTSGVFVAREGRVIGALLLEDPPRLEAARALRALRRQGVGRLVMVSGDRQEVAEVVALALGVDTVLSGRSPTDKVEAVRVERRAGTTLMVGDGLNDAPALSAADVGVAMGVRGTAAAAEAADVVLLVDRLDRLPEALGIARRTVQITRQSVALGMGLAFVAMGAAAFGFLTPLAGALLQEGIDVLAILSALRALRGRRRSARALAISRELAVRHEAHETFLPFVDRCQALADRLDELPSKEVHSRLLAIQEELETRVLPHEEADEDELYPRLAQHLEGEDPMGTMARAHREIRHLARRFERLLEEIGPEGPSRERARELRRVLMSLAAVLRLHYAQEDELFDAYLEP